MKKNRFLIIPQKTAKTETRRGIRSCFRVGSFSETNPCLLLDRQDSSLVISIICFVARGVGEKVRRADGTRAE